ncbi:NAD(P)-dependent glycerol-3-phosphate dehydrogenase [Granulosicoccus sp.]|nr:NAD(P)H-dependent glycerol-3-phosphate dehydrogenase [Granulosicoccus sp.]MDB4224436.1 NAD(P)-dependent glycerol-3-phosphate dehydrogenase [Granulosicoccus sp.]
MMQTSAEEINAERFLVIGAGSWGTALAIQLARAGNQVALWGRDVAHMEEMKKVQANERYLPGSKFPTNLAVTAELEQALQSADFILISVPSHAFRAVLIQLKSLLGSRITSVKLCWATKGFELSTGELPHQLVQEVLPECKDYAVVSGPTFALEVGAGLPTAITVAGANEAWSSQLAGLLRSKTFIAYTSQDIVGVEIGGAVKNALAIGAGLSDGLGFGANARIALINRGLRELSRLGVAMGAKEETFIGLAGMGDLVLTCTDNQSRNRRMGLALAAGKSIKEAAIEIGQVVEGIGAARAVYEQAQRLDIRMPIIEQIYRIVVEGVDPQDAVEALLTRELNAGAEHG